MICSHLFIGAAGKTAPTKAYQLPLKNVFYVVVHGNYYEGFYQTPVSTLAVKHNLLVIGGFHGEIICKVIFFILNVFSYFCLLEDFAIRV